MSRRLSGVPESWGDSPDFVFGNREAFKNYASSDAFTRWHRAMFAAWGHVRANGHATFRPGELAWILGDPVEGGGWQPAPRQRVHEALHGAMDRGLLLPMSKARCLIVPPGVVAYGRGKSVPCRFHSLQPCDEEMSRPNRDVPPKRSRFLQDVSEQMSRPDRDISKQKSRPNRDVSRSAPSPLLSSLKDATDLDTEDAS